MYIWLLNFVRIRELKQVLKEATYRQVTDSLPTLCRLSANRWWMCVVKKTRPTVGRLLTGCWSNDGQLLAGCWSSVGLGESVYRWGRFNSHRTTKIAAFIVLENQYRALNLRTRMTTRATFNFQFPRLFFKIDTSERFIVLLSPPKLARLFPLKEVKPSSDR